MNRPTPELALAEHFMQAITECDIDAVRECYAPDARIWHNFDQAEQSIDDNINTLQWIHTKLSDLRYEIVRRAPIPGGFCQQHVLRGKLASGDDFAMPACVVVKIEGGRIVSLDEYLDTKHTEPLLAKSSRSAE